MNDVTTQTLFTTSLLESLSHCECNFNCCITNLKQRIPKKNELIIITKGGSVLDSSFIGRCYQVYDVVTKPKNYYLNSEYIETVYLLARDTYNERNTVLIPVDQDQYSIIKIQI